MPIDKLPSCSVSLGDIRHSQWLRLTAAIVRIDPLFPVDIRTGKMGPRLQSALMLMVGILLFFAALKHRIGRSQGMFMGIWRLGIGYL